MLPCMTWDLELPSSTHYSISDVKILTVVLVSDGYHGESFRPVLSCVHRVCCPECERSLTGHGTSEHMPLVMTVTVCCWRAATSPNQAQVQVLWPLLLSLYLYIIY